MFFWIIHDSKKIFGGDFEADSPPTAAATTTTATARKAFQTSPIGKMCQTSAIQSQPGHVLALLLVATSILSLKRRKCACWSLKIRGCKQHVDSSFQDATGGLRGRSHHSFRTRVITLSFYRNCSLTVQFHRSCQGLAYYCSPLPIIKETRASSYVLED